MPIKIKLSCASGHEPDQLTTNVSGFPREVQREINKLPARAPVVLRIRPKSTTVDWHWAWQTNRKGPSGTWDTITTRTFFSSRRMITPDCPGTAIKLDVKSVLVNGKTFDY